MKNEQYTQEFALIQRLIEEFRNQNIVILCRYSEQIDAVLKKTDTYFLRGHDELKLVKKYTVGFKLGCNEFLFKKEKYGN